MAKAKKKKPVKAKKKNTAAASTKASPRAGQGPDEAPKVGASSPAPVVMSPMPTAGEKVTEFEAALDEQIRKHPQPQHGGSRPGSGRKVKPKPPPAPEIQPVAPGDISSAITELLRAPFDLWALRAKLPQLALTNDEAITLTGPVQVLLDYYVPNMRPIDWAWISLAITGVAIMRPRMILLASIGPDPHGSAAQGGASQGSQRRANGRPPGSAASPPLGATGFPDGSREPVRL